MGISDLGFDSDLFSLGWGGGELSPRKVSQLLLTLPSGECEEGADQTHRGH